MTMDAKMKALRAKYKQHHSRDSLGREYCWRPKTGKVPCPSKETPKQGHAAAPQFPQQEEAPKPPPQAGSTGYGMPQRLGDAHEAVEGMARGEGHRGKLPEDLNVSERCRIDGDCSPEEEALIEQYLHLQKAFDDEYAKLRQARERQDDIEVKVYRKGFGWLESDTKALADAKEAEKQALDAITAVRKAQADLFGRTGEQV
jgi:hypothetical protein